jgi:hypothetical protein
MPRIAILAAITIAGCLASAVSRADICHSPSAPSVFPEPATASDAEMVAAQLDVKKYLSDMESSLKCLTAAHDNQAYDHAVQEMQRAASTFNGVLRAFRARQQKS